MDADLHSAAYSAISFRRANASEPVRPCMFNAYHNLKPWRVHAFHGLPATTCAQGWSVPIYSDRVLPPHTYVHVGKYQRVATLPIGLDKLRLNTSPCVLFIHMLISFAQTSVPSFCSFCSNPMDYNTRRIQQRRGSVTND